jgi:hypothetical protein
MDDAGGDKVMENDTSNWVARLNSTHGAQWYLMWTVWRLHALIRRSMLPGYGYRLVREFGQNFD